LNHRAERRSGSRLRSRARLSWQRSGRQRHFFTGETHQGVKPTLVTDRFRASGNFLYIGSHAGKLIAVDLRSHRVAWTFETDGARANGARWTKTDGSPNYQAAYSDFFYDDMVAGAQRLMSVGAVLGSPVVDSDTIYFGSWDGNLYAVD